MTEIVIDEVTTGKVSGTGAFDELMQSIQVRLEAEYNANRLKGTEYSKVYLGAMQETIQQGLAFVLGRQQASAQADLLIKQGSLVDVEIANGIKNGLLIDQQILKSIQEVSVLEQGVLKSVQEVKVLEQQVLLSAKEVLKIDADIELIGQQILSLQKQNEIADADILIKQQQILITQQELLLKQAELALAEEQLVKMASDIDKINAEIAIMGKQESLLESNLVVAGIEESIATTYGLEKASYETLLVEKQMINELTEHADLYNGYVVSGTTARQNAKLEAETKLVEEQNKLAELSEAGVTNQNSKIQQESDLIFWKSITERAQIQDSITYTVPGGSPTTTSVSGIVGKQRLVYERQAEGFLRESEQKLAKIYADTFAVRKSADENAVTPSSLTDQNINLVMDAAKRGVGING